MYCIVLHDMLCILIHMCTTQTTDDPVMLTPTVKGELK